MVSARTKCLRLPMLHSHADVDAFLVSSVSSFHLVARPAEALSWQTAEFTGLEQLKSVLCRD